MADDSVEVVETSGRAEAATAAAAPLEDISCVRKREPGKVTKIIKVGVMVRAYCSLLSIFF